MEPQQNSTPAPGITTFATATVEPKPVESLISPQQDEYIAFVACNGMLPTEDSSELVRKMTAAEFAAEKGVDRTTLYNWRKSIPNFWDRVNEKRKELGGKDRLSKVWNGLFLKAASGNPQAAAIYLANFDPNFRMPAQKVEHDVGENYAALLAAAAKDGVIEGTVVETKQINPTASYSDQPPHPQAS